MDLSKVFINRPDLLDDEKKIKNALSDFYGSDISKINRMIKAYEIGIIGSIKRASNSDIEKKKLVSKLVSLHDMQEEKAKDAVNEWWKICTKKVLQEYEKYLSKIELEKKQKTAAKNKSGESISSNDDTNNLNQIIGDLVIDYDNYDRYINLDLSKGNVVRGIPCGVGNGDYGFEVKGTGKEDVNNHDLLPSVHALVYNFLIRDSHITRDSYPQYMKNHSFNHELDYGHVYRLIMILLDLLKPKGETVLHLSFAGDRDELTAAVDILNQYLGVFGRLSRTDPCSLKIIDDPKGKSISVTEKADYYVENYSSDKGLRRRLRYGQRINYKLGKKDREDLEFLLREISSFKTFKKGQYDALCSMLNANGHAVCIMPTGSGKSLIYYFACILQPQVVFVVSPTDILIRDQIRNLRKFHHFDNAMHLSLTGDNDFSFFKPGTNLIFLTPTTFQNRNLFGAFKRWKNEISYVVLDEIHCLSSWGHDFRPEYLMLSRNMSRYLDNARYLGFTATANYTVAQDIQKQLEIPQENFFSPVLFEKYNVRYDFRAVESQQDMFEQVKKIANAIVQRGERALIFTKNEDTSRAVAEAIGYEADFFSSDNEESYVQFVEGYCNILVTSEDLGIGINLPDVNCTVHFGMPLSKNEYVQEIGRAGRADERVTSYVVYLTPDEKNIPASLLKRETMIDNLPQILKTMNNDYADVYQKLNCGADTSDILYDKLIDIYSDFHSGQKVAYMMEYPRESIAVYKRLIYILYAIGYVKDWYAYRTLNDDKEIELIIDICTVSNAAGHGVVVLDDKSMLERMKKRSRDYFTLMGNDRESVFKVSRATNCEDVIRVYVDWYYEKFLYHHKEEFLDCFSFIVENKACDSVKITEEIEGYFTLPFIQIKDDEEYYSSMTFQELSRQIEAGIGKNTLTNLERINSNSYSYKLDYLLFMGNWSRSGRFDAGRLERFWDKLSDDERKICLSTLTDLYPDCRLEAKWACLRYVDDRNNALKLQLPTFIDMIYTKTPKDQIFYGVLASVANLKFREFVRSI